MTSNTAKPEGAPKVAPKDTREGASDAPHEYGRPDVIEDASNRYFIHPLSDHVVRAAHRMGLSANGLSFLGLACGVGAAFLYYRVADPLFAVGGFLAMIAWHILDGADGKLARLTGTSSAFGRIIDGICDHVVFAAVYIALALYLMEQGHSTAIWWLVVAAGLSHAVQAAGYEERRQKYQRRRDGILRDSAQASLLVVDGRQSLLAGLYDTAQKLVSGGNYGLDAAIDVARREDKQVAAALVAATRPMVKAWGLLNANNRTLLIFLCAVAGEPIYYFLFEVLVWNVAMAALMVAEWRLEKSLVRRADKTLAAAA